MMADERARRRLWLVFFQPCRGAWYERFLAPGFAHVGALSFHADLDCWLVVQPIWYGGAVVEVRKDDDAAFQAWFAQMVADARIILRVPSEKRVGTMVRGGWCVSVVKGVLGFRSRALTPVQLCKHLLAAGAEVAEVPTRAEIEAKAARQSGTTSDVHVLH